MSFEIIKIALKLLSCLITWYLFLFLLSLSLTGITWNFINPSNAMHFRWCNISCICVNSNWTCLSSLDSNWTIKSKLVSAKLPSLNWPSKVCRDINARKHKMWMNRASRVSTRDSQWWIEVSHKYYMIWCKASNYISRMQLTIFLSLLLCIIWNSITLHNISQSLFCHVLLLFLHFQLWYDCCEHYGGCFVYDVKHLEEGGDLQFWDTVYDMML